jgi:anti-sigma regulatory factor (Ser/Thr protein kinase)
MPDLVYKLEFDQPKGNSFGAQLKEILEFLEFLQDNPFAGKITLGLEKLEFVYPLFVLPLAVLHNDLLFRGIKLDVNPPIQTRCFSYLRKIKFPGGIKPDQLPDWEKTLQKYNGKNFFPIINFTTEQSPEHVKIREKLLSEINRLLKENLQLGADSLEGISYLISEISDNILEHSGTSRGWILIQYYPNTEYLDICIIDTGKTILGSYRDSNMAEITTDETAIEKALWGISTKSSERGSGIRTTKAISLLGMKGDFAILSGNAMYYKEKIINLPVRWSGTFVAMRIKKSVPGFSIYNYL